MLFLERRAVYIYAVPLAEYLTNVVLLSNINVHADQFFNSCCLNTRFLYHNLGVTFQTFGDSAGCFSPKHRHWIRSNFAYLSAPFFIPPTAFSTILYKSFVFFADDCGNQYCCCCFYLLCSCFSSRIAAT